VGSGVGSGVGSTVGSGVGSKVGVISGVGSGVGVTASSAIVNAGPKVKIVIANIINREISFFTLRLVLRFAQSSLSASTFNKLAESKCPELVEGYFNVYFLTFSKIELVFKQNV